MPFKIVPSESLSQKVYDLMRKRIIDGEMAADERLVIDRLAREMGVSIMPVREALVRLHAEKLLVFQQNYGYRVSPKPQAEDITQWMEARVMIEQAAAPLAASRISAAALAEMRSINAEIERRDFGVRADTLSVFVDLNQRFHDLLVAASGNPLIVSCYTHLGYGPQLARELSGHGLDDKASIVEEHARIIDALARGDARRAIEAVQLHIVDGLTRVRERVDATQAGAAKPKSKAPRKSAK